MGPPLRRVVAHGWTSADAAGLPIFPGLVRNDEAAAGRVDHALRVTIDNTGDACVHPASHCAGNTANALLAADGRGACDSSRYPLGGLTARRARSPCR